jgi:hypothetical protein
LAQIKQKPTERLIPNALARRSDDVIRGGGDNPSTHFDEAIVNPGADSYFRCQHLDTIDLAAAIFTEKRKTRYYVTSYGEAFRHRIRPFILEAT